MSAKGRQFCGCGVRTDIACAVAYEAHGADHRPLRPSSRIGGDECPSREQRNHEADSMVRQVGID